jgi:hypothetical protein
MERRPPSGEGDRESDGPGDKAQWGAEELRAMLQRQRQEKRAQIEVHPCSVCHWLGKISSAVCNRN